MSEAHLHHPDPAPRRPGVDRLINEIKRRNPTWSMDRVCIEAKQQWQANRTQRIGQQQGGAA